MSHSNVVTLFKLTLHFVIFYQFALQEVVRIWFIYFINYNFNYCIIIINIIQTFIKIIIMFLFRTHENTHTKTLFITIKYYSIYSYNIFLCGPRIKRISEP